MIFLSLVRVVRFTHLAMVIFETLSGAKMTHVLYKDTGPALTDLLGGHIQLMFGSMPTLISHVKADRLRAVGVTTIKRVGALPDVPTIPETLPRLQRGSLSRHSISSFALGVSGRWLFHVIPSSRTSFGK